MWTHQNKQGKKRTGKKRAGVLDKTLFTLLLFSFSLLKRVWDGELKKSRDEGGKGEWACPTLFVPSFHYRGIDGAVQKFSLVSCASPESPKLREVVQPPHKHLVWLLQLQHTHHSHPVNKDLVSPWDHAELLWVPEIRSQQLHCTWDSEPATAEMMMMRMQQNSRGFLVLLLLVFIAGRALSGPSTPRRSRGRWLLHCCHCLILKYPQEEIVLIASGAVVVMVLWKSKIHASAHHCDCCSV